MNRVDELAAIAALAHRLRRDWPAHSVESYLAANYPTDDPERLLVAVWRLAHDHTATKPAALKSRSERYWPPPSVTGPPEPPRIDWRTGLPPRRESLPPAGASAADVARLLAERHASDRSEPVKEPAT